MTATTGAALALALAAAVLPSSPRRRLVTRRQQLTGGARTIRFLPAIAAAVLFLTVTGVFVALATMLLSAVLIVRQRRRVAKLRADRDGRAMEGALDVLVSELRVGTHPVRAFRIAADETGGAVGVAFGAVAARAGLGADVPAGLRSAALQSPRRAEWERLAVSWQLATEHGLAISVLMRAAQLDIVERQRFSSRVAAGMAGARATATILAGLPLLGVVLGELIGAAPLAFLMGSGAGGWCLVVGVALVCAGLWWSDRITDRLVS